MLRWRWYDSRVDQSFFYWCHLYPPRLVSICHYYPSSIAVAKLSNPSELTYYFVTVESGCLNVPLEQGEKEWIVKSALGDCNTISRLLLTDKNLVYYKDFISGYTGRSFYYVKSWFGNCASMCSPLFYIISNFSTLPVYLDVTEITNISQKFATSNDLLVS